MVQIGDTAQLPPFSHASTADSRGRIAGDEPGAVRAAPAPASPQGRAAAAWAGLSQLSASDAAPALLHASFMSRVHALRSRSHGRSAPRAPPGRDGLWQLREQYRMPLSICRLVSGLFYGNLLRTAATVAAADAEPLTWVDTSSRAGGAQAEARAPAELALNIFVERRHSPALSALSQDTAPSLSQTSLHNLGETKIVRALYDRIRDTEAQEFAKAQLRLATDGTQVQRPLSVMVISMYSAQVWLLQAQFVGELSPDSGRFDSFLRVHTVDSAQGAESDIVILSLVTSWHPCP